MVSYFLLPRKSFKYRLKSQLLNLFRQTLNLTSSAHRTPLQESAVTMNKSSQWAPITRNSSWVSREFLECSAFNSALDAVRVPENYAFFFLLLLAIRQSRQTLFTCCNKLNVAYFKGTFCISLFIQLLEFVWCFASFSFGDSVLCKLREFKTCWAFEFGILICKLNYSIILKC